ncbi:toll-like receptor 4 [Patiria miniata]|uniref:TIR domain-containing protein n=1 Tax=Patiria miniata TaxID=46514 RepID=A0A914AQU3_PATMI|nr:toll-like receptor 4 [Patiria miniata]
MYPYEIDREQPACNNLPDCSCPSYGDTYGLELGLTLSCRVGPNGFNFSQFHGLNLTMNLWWSLEFYSNFNPDGHSSSPLVIPRNAIPASASVTPFRLLINNVELVSVERGAFAGRTLTVLWFRGTQMTSLPLDSFRDQSANLKLVVIQGVSQKNGEPIGFPSFHSFQALRTLAIEHTPIKYLPDQFFIYNLLSLEEFILDSAQTTQGVSPRAFQDLPVLSSMTILKCMLQQVPIDALSSLANLTNLDLSLNDIQTLSAVDIEALKRLPSLFQVTLGDNPFSCTCDLLPFIKLLQGGSPFDIRCERYGLNSNNDCRCASPEQLRGKLLADLSHVNWSVCTAESTVKPENLTTRDYVDSSTVTRRARDYVDSSTVTRLSISIISAVVVLGIAVVVVVVIVHRKMKLRWVGLFRRYDRPNSNVYEGDGEGYAYDAYICHHSEMEVFVSEQMIQRLEGEPNNFRLCVSFRDFLVGADKLDNVATAMTSSRLIIVLLDANFIASGQCMLELNMASTRMLDATVGAAPVAPAAAGNAAIMDGAAGLLLVLLDALPVDALPATLTVLRDKITCLEWRQEDEERCWRQLVASIQATRPRQPQQMDIED